MKTMSVPLSFLGVVLGRNCRKNMRNSAVISRYNCVYSTVYILKLVYMNLMSKENIVFNM